MAEVREAKVNRGGDFSTADQFPHLSIDSKLRKKGFRIWQRKPGQSPIWEKEGKFFSQPDIVNKYL